MTGALAELALALYGVLLLAHGPVIGLSPLPF